MMHSPIFLRPASVPLILGVLLGLAAAARAGGGPENVLLVVNRSSPESLTIANHYVRLRAIPPGNVVTLPWPPTTQTTDIATFRSAILDPVLKELDKRRLSGQIDYVVYSSGFPTAVTLDADVQQFLDKAKQEAAAQTPEGKTPPPINWPTHLTKVGSITGLTYLWQPVRSGVIGYLDTRSNAYFRAAAPAGDGPASLAFQATQSFGPNGTLLPTGGRRYLLSVMLGVTAGRGNTLDEVLACLKHSAAADGTQPRGTIYFVQNADIRSKVRESLFPAAVRELKELGVSGEVVQGVLPYGKDDVQGAVVGTPDFDWNTAKSKILPGAICEHFTSYGGVMVKDGGQTPISQWIRHGAAGTSGAVTEPYAILDKFPTPMVHVHYARGCTLAEAFYQSVAGPYQLLILGDPLCRPWANIAKVLVAGVEPGATVQGKLTLTPTATLPKPGQVEQFELFVDELRHSRCKPGETLALDTAQLADGHHELRIVAIEAGPIRSQGRVIVPIWAANHGRAIEAALMPARRAAFDGTLTVTARSPGASGIVVLHNSHIVGRIAGEGGAVEVKCSALGRGPVALRVIGLGASPQQYTWSKPLETTVE